jgi:hypothetical protein
MAPPADPYRTLGLGRDATLEQVKRAYRRLAKANHPDTAGEAAVPRFLAIKAAYEAIAGPEASDATRPGRRSTGPRRAWEADPARADATRRAYGSRARGPRPGPRPAPGPRPGPATAPPPGPDTPQRPPNLATLGSTTYDSAAGQPFEPDWRGASWYGTTSGTYWTINPKEYADPRKHGPEYQARARRARRGEDDAPEDVLTRTAAGASSPDGRPPGPTSEPPSEPTDEPTGGIHGRDGEDRPVVESTPMPGAANPTAAAPDPTHTTASWWDATAGAATAGAATAGPATAGAATTGAPTAGAPTAGATTAGAAGPGPSPVADPPVEPAGRDDLRERFLDSGRFGVVGRVGFAVLGWAPVAAGIGAVAGELTGCARAAATCSAADAPIASFAQIGLLAVLLLVPLLGRLAAMAAVVVLAVAVPGVLLLEAFAEPGVAPSFPVGFALLLVAAWLIGLAVAGLRESRRPARPVS